MPLDLDHRQIQIRARQDRLAELARPANRRVRRERAASVRRREPVARRATHRSGTIARGLVRLRSAMADVAAVLVVRGAAADGQLPIAARSRGSR